MSHASNEWFVSVDESTIPCYGRHGAKQHLRGKLIRFGYKVWSLATTRGDYTRCTADSTKVLQQVTLDNTSAWEGQLLWM